MTQTHPPPLPWLLRYTRTLLRRFVGLNVSQINPLLYVGGQFRAGQWPLLYAQGIRAVLSMQIEHEDRFAGPPPDRTLRLHVVDHRAPSLEQLTAGVQFLAAAHQDGLPVLVHCRAGKGRAPTMAAAYLVAHHGMDARAALRYLAAQRPIVALNRVQRQRLHEWSQHVGAG